MKLDAIDWQVLTRPWAARMVSAASQRTTRMGERFERDEISEVEFLAAYQIEEDLRVFAITGERPCP